MPAILTAKQPSLNSPSPGPSPRSLLKLADPDWLVAQAMMR
jgi:hypothetical protein